MNTSLDDDSAERHARDIGVRVGLSILVAIFAAFWIWALFFSSKEAINKIDDRAWAARAQEICVEATEERLKLINTQVIVDATPAMIHERADIIEEATGILERMVDDVVAVAPTDQKGSEIVPLWEADYRTYLGDRATYIEQLRESGENLSFYESAESGIPISERIATFAGDNEMSACAPPFDLTR